MCGIFATTRLDLWRGRVDEVLGALHHRGPDGEGTWIDEESGVLLVHTRLAIVGLGPDGAQPHALGDSTLTYNGEVYNHAQIAKSLRFPPSACDTPTVHEVLRQKGPAGLGLLDGMFALAWWEQRRQRLVIARDPWGIKPLYLMRHVDGGVSVASELSVLALLRPSVDPQGLAHFVAFGHTSSTSTVLERVSKLAPGSYLQVDRVGTSWRSTSGTIVPADGHTRPLGEVLNDAVRDHLMSDVPIGVFLSGGTDSTLVTALAARQETRLQSFTLSFPDAPHLDESLWAGRNAARLGIEHTIVPATTRQMVAAAYELVRSSGEPAGDPAALAVDVLSAAASERVKVVLTGEGTDELFGGYARHHAIRRLSRGRAWLFRPLLSSAARFACERRGDAAWQRAVVAGLSGGGAIGYAALQQAELSVFESRFDLFNSLTAQLRTDWEMASQSTDTSDTALAFDQRRILPNLYLEKIDRTTMRHGIEGRVPFLSGGVAQWARTNRPFGKQVLVDELRQLLPEVDLPEKKKGLAIDSAGLLRAGLGEQLERVLSSKESVLHQAFGTECLARMRTRASRSPAFSYRLAILGVWEDVTGSAA